jgi:hypothetical protein
LVTSGLGAFPSAHRRCKRASRASRSAARSNPSHHASDRPADAKVAQRRVGGGRASAGFDIAAHCPGYTRLSIAPRAYAAVHCPAPLATVGAQLVIQAEPASFQQKAALNSVPPFASTTQVGLIPVLGPYRKFAGDRDGRSLKCS